MDTECVCDGLSWPWGQGWQIVLVKSCSRQTDGDQTQQWQVRSGLFSLISSTDSVPVQHPTSLSTHMALDYLLILFNHRICKTVVVQMIINTPKKNFYCNKTVEGVSHWYHDAFLQYHLNTMLITQSHDIHIKVCPYFCGITLVIQCFWNRYHGIFEASCHPIS